VIAMPPTDNNDRAEPKDKPESPSDFDLAMQLLEGYRQGPYYERAYLTGPAENAGRAALVRILDSFRVPRGICFALARLFAPNGSPNSDPRRLEFRYRSKNREDQTRDLMIALHVHELRRQGMSAEDAKAQVGSESDLGERQIANLYAKHRSYLESDCSVAKAAQALKMKSVPFLSS
jgi:hypothetical protein